MATSTVDLVQPSGNNLVTLSGAIKSDSEFTTQPVASEQIVWLSGQGVSINEQLAITGPVGTYEVWHIQLNGTTVKESYTIDGSLQSSSNVNLLPPSGYSKVVMTGTITSDGAFSTQPIDTDMILFPSSIDVDGQLNISGPSGTYSLYHIIASSGQTYVTSYQVTGGSGYFSYVDLIPGEPNTVATLVSGFDTYVFENWNISPVVGEQLFTTTSAGYFDSLANYYSEFIHTHDAWLIALDGSATHFVVDSQELTQTVDTEPYPFTFPSRLGQQINTSVESQAVVLSGIGDGVNSPISVSSNCEYSVSADGTSYSSYTSVAGNVQNGYYIKLRTTTPSTYSASKTCTATVGGVSGNWLVSTTVADTTPDAFYFSPVTGAATSTQYESNAVSVLGVVSNYDIPISITDGEYSVSTNNGQHYSDWTTEAGNVRLGYLVKVRRTSSSNNGALVSSTLTMGGVSSNFEVSTLSAGEDTTPDSFQFPDKTGLSFSTLVESDPVAITGLSANATVSISINNGQYAKSTNGGGTYQSYTSSVGTVGLGDVIKVRHTTASTAFTSVISTVTIGGITSSFTSTTNQGNTVITSGTVNTPAVRTITLGSRRTVANKVYTQDTSDRLDYAFDFTNWLASGDTINGVGVIEGEECVKEGSFSSTHVMGWVTCPASTYDSDAKKITFRVGTTQGAIVDVSFYVAFLDY